MKCLDCGTYRAEYCDPRTPPLELDECLCEDCAVSAAIDVVAEVLEPFDESARQQICREAGGPE